MSEYIQRYGSIQNSRYTQHDVDMAYAAADTAYTFMGYSAPDSDERSAWLNQCLFHIAYLRYVHQRAPDLDFTAVQSSNFTARQTSMDEDNIIVPTYEEIIDQAVPSGRALKMQIRRR